MGTAANQYLSTKADRSLRLRSAKNHARITKQTELRRAGYQPWQTRCSPWNQGFAEQYRYDRDEREDERVLNKSLTGAAAFFCREHLFQDRTNFFHSCFISRFDSKE